MIRHFRIWNEWRKRSKNNRMHKMLVLFKIKRSPTFRVYKRSIACQEAFIHTIKEEAKAIKDMKL